MVVAVLQQLPQLGAAFHVFTVTWRRARHRCFVNASALPRRFDEPRLGSLLEAIGSLSGAWRRAFVAQINPRPRDVIVEIGCGEGELTLLLAAAAPDATLIAIDADAEALRRAEARAHAAGAKVQFIHSQAHDVAQWGSPLSPNKIVASLALLDTPSAEMAMLLRDIHRALSPDGVVHIAEFGAQDAPLMRQLFSLTHAPDARGAEALPRLMREAGFKAVDEARRFATVRGSISLFSARAN
jgi:ubiquinone/menaquinone biosynthesis C-methylase UbiE